MNSRRINQILWSVAALLTAGAAIVLALGITLPLDSGDAQASKGPIAPAGTGGSALPTVASLEPLWDLRLRGELLPAPASTQPARLAAADITPATRNVPVSLVGTIGDSLAILRHDSGQVEIRAAGENIAGVEVIEVHPARVRVRFNGEVVTLEKPHDAGGL